MKKNKQIYYDVYFAFALSMKKKEKTFNFCYCFMPNVNSGFWIDVTQGLIFQLQPCVSFLTASRAAGQRRPAEAPPQQEAGPDGGPGSDADSHH